MPPTYPLIPGYRAALLYLTAWTEAFKIYAYDPQTQQVADTKLQPTGPYDDPVNVESVEVKVQSYDGTLVPLSITHPKSLKFDGSNPTLLAGYGAYGISYPAYFDSKRLAWYDKAEFTRCAMCGAAESMGRSGTWRERKHQAQYLA